MVDLLISGGTLWRIWRRCPLSLCHPTRHPPLRSAHSRLLFKIPHPPLFHVSQLAGLPPVYGLYASLTPLIVYFLMGTGRHVSVGPFALVSLLVAKACTDIAPATDPPSTGEVLCVRACVRACVCVCVCVCVRGSWVVLRHHVALPFRHHPLPQSTSMRRLCWRL